MLFFLKEEKNAKMQEKNQVKPLTKEEKRAIFKSIRYTYMSHSELQTLIKDPDFKDGKDFIR